jgi:hypothetical protein
MKVSHHTDSEQSQTTIINFPHDAPDGYSYEFEEFKKNVISIWIRNHSHFDYNGGARVRSIWGFYNQKTKCYYSPVNSKTPGKEVNIENTTPYTAMPPKRTPLEMYFV